MRIAAPRPSIAVEIVPAVGGDARDLAMLHATCFDDPWRADLIARVLGSPGGFGLLARSPEALIGFALCRSVAGEGEVLTLCVAARARRRGTGRTLLDAVLNAAARRGLTSLFLEVAEDNTAGRALYASVGFEPVGRRSAYYRYASGAVVDALTLRCNLEFLFNSDT